MANTVLNYGAVGNGTTDDTAAFQAMYVAENQVILPEAGMYNFYINGPVGSLTDWAGRDDAGPKFKGAGKDRSIVTFGPNGGFRVSGRRWSITDFTFRASGVVACAVKTGTVNDSHGSSFSNNSFEADWNNTGYFGIILDAYRLWYSKIEGNDFRNAGARGICLRFNFSVNNSIVNNTFAGFDIAYQWTTVKSEGSTGHVCEGHMVANNIFVINRKDFKIEAGLLLTIIGNVIDLSQLSGQAGTQTGPSTEIAATNCIIQSNWFASLAGMGDSDVQVFIQNSTGHVITGNVWANNGQKGTGLTLLNVTESVISDNVFRFYGTGVGALPGCDKLIVTNNMFTAQGGVGANLGNVTNLKWGGNINGWTTNLLPSGTIDPWNPPAAPAQTPSYAVTTVVQSTTSSDTQVFNLSFPGGRFSSAPIVTATIGYNTGARLLVYVLDNVSASGCQFLLKTADGSPLGNGAYWRINLIAQAAG